MLLAGPQLLGTLAVHGHQPGFGFGVLRRPGRRQCLNVGQVRSDAVGCRADRGGECPFGPPAGIRYLRRRRLAQRPLEKPVQGDPGWPDGDQVIVPQGLQRRLGVLLPAVHVLQHDQGQRLGGVPGQCVEQGHGQGMPGADGLQTGTADPGDRAGRRAVAPEAGLGLVGQLRPIGGEPRPGLPQVGACLCQSQRQVAQVVRQQLGLRALGGCTSWRDVIVLNRTRRTEEIHRRVVAEHIEADQLGALGPTVTTPARHQLVSPESSRPRKGVRCSGRSTLS